jgi:hypothetical protein
MWSFAKSVLEATPFSFLENVPAVAAEVAVSSAIFYKIKLRLIK